MPRTTLVNVGYDRAEVYIGRGPNSPWGNPFTDKQSKYASRLVATREEAIKCFREWLEGIDYQYLLPERRQWILEHLEDLRGKILGCWCKPKPCHGDVYLELLDKADPYLNKEVHIYGE